MIYNIIECFFDSICQNLIKKQLGDLKKWLQPAPSSKTNIRKPIHNQSYTIGLFTNIRGKDESLSQVGLWSILKLA